MTDLDPSTLTDDQIRAVMAEAARRGASKRPRSDRDCIACGATIPDVLKSRRYCTDACRCRAGYWRKKGKETDDPTAPFRIPLTGKGWESARSYNRKVKSKKRP